MRRRLRLRWYVATVLAVLLPALNPCTSGQAQDTTEATNGAPENPFEPQPAPVKNGLQQEYARLANVLNSSGSDRGKAATTLLRVRPADVTDPNTRKLIARGYKSLADSAYGSDKATAIEGLVIWGGKYSVPILIEMMEKDGHNPPDECFNALAQLKDPRGAEVVARYLGDFFSHDKAVAALRRMGPSAEDALIKAAPSNNPDASVAAVLILGDVGGEKSIPILTKASNARNPQVKQAARDAIKKIRQRQKTGQPPAAAAGEDPNSPFAAAAGPPIDITASAANSEPSEVSTEAYSGDWSQVNSLQPGEPLAKVAPADPARNDVDPKWTPTPVRLGKSLARDEVPLLLAVSGGTSPMAVVYHSSPHGGTIARLEHLSLRRSNTSKSTNIVGGASSMALSPAGTRLLIMTPDASQGGATRFDVFAFNNGLAMEQATWWPFPQTDDSLRRFRRSAGWAQWLDEDQLISGGNAGSVVLWRLEGKTPRAIYEIATGVAGEAGLSPGRGQLAVPNAGGVDVYRTTDGTLLARLGGSNEAGIPSFLTGPSTAAFNAAGDRVAVVAGSNVTVWNTTTGQRERDFLCANLVPTGLNGVSVDWLDDSHLLVAGSDVVDLDRRLIAWRFERSPGQVTNALAHFGGWQWLVMRSGNAVGIVPGKMLLPETLQAANALNADEVLALKPGAKVALDINVGGEEQAKVEAALRAAVERSGMEVVSDSPLRISAQIVTGESKTNEFTRTFRNQGTEQVTTTEKRYEVEVKVDGESMFKTGSMMQSAGAPMMVALKEGESVQQVVDRDNAERTKNFQFDVTLPRYAVHPKFAGPLGKSPLPIGGRR